MSRSKNINILPCLHRLGKSSGYWAPKTIDQKYLRLVAYLVMLNEKQKFSASKRLFFTKLKSKYCSHVFKKFSVITVYISKITFMQKLH